MRILFFMGQGWMVRNLFGSRRCAKRQTMDGVWSIYPIGQRHNPPSRLRDNIRSFDVIEPNRPLFRGSIKKR